MPVLEPQDYDISYFDGKKARYSHNAGYGNYERQYISNSPNSLGEFWKDYAKNLAENYHLRGKKVLDIGCAKGFIVKDLRDMGADAYGLDVSSYAIGQCEAEVAPYLTIGDARTYLKNYKKDEFDVVFSLRFMECIPEEDIPGLIAQMNRISLFQFHVIDEEVKPRFYLNKPIEEWIKYDWNIGTALQCNENRNKKLTK